MVVAALAVVVPVPTGTPRYVGAAAVLAVLTVTALVLRSAPATRALVYLGVAFGVFAAGDLASLPPALTTVVVGVVPVVALLGCNRASRLRPAAPWLRRGRPTAVAVVLGAAALVGGGLAMLVWTTLARPEPPAYLNSLPDAPGWLAVAGVVGFALVNPLWEEALFRGVVLEELAATWGVRVAVVVQAVAFGAAHWAGFPSGWLGMGMAACWGLALGVIRVSTGGILASYLVHVGVNATMGTVAVLLLG